MRKPGDDRREGGRKVDAEGSLDRADVEHRGRVADLGRDGAHAFGRVHEHREADAKAIKRCASPSPRPRTTMAAGTIAIAGIARELARGSSVREPARRSHRETERDPDRRTEGEARREPRRLAATSPGSRPSATRAMHAPARGGGGEEERRPRLRRRLPEAEDRDEDCCAQSGVLRCVRQTAPSSRVRPLRADPEERTALDRSEREVDAVAEERRQHDRAVQLGEVVGVLLPLHVPAHAAAALEELDRDGDRSAIAALSRTPAAMLGTAAGSVTRTILPSRDAPAVRATSCRRRSTPRTPYSVAIRTGQTAAQATTNRRIGSRGRTRTARAE